MSTTRHFAVVGRMPGDDEDSVFFYDVASKADACEAFEVEMYEDIFDDPDARSRTIKAYGMAVFITAVLVSDSPILEI